MSSFFSLTDDSVTRLAIIVFLGLCQCITMLLYPPLAKSALIVAFLISVFAGTVSPRFKDWISAAAGYFLGFVSGMIVISIIILIFNRQRQDDPILFIWPLTKVAVLLGLTSLTPWVVGLPLGFLAKKFLLRNR